MYCTNCGEETEPKDSLCTHCGHDLSDWIALVDEPDEDDDDLDPPDIKIRGAQEIARRALTLSAVVACAYGRDRQDVVQWLKAENLWQEATPEEREFLLGETDEETRVNQTWKTEALVPLLWSINKLAELPGLDGECDTDPLKKAVVWPPDPTAEYIASATLRSEEEIYAQHENVYQAHWKVRDARINNKRAPRNLDPGVVYERHYGFNWIIGYWGQAWDDITTDT